VYQAAVLQWVNDWGPLITLSAGVLLAAITGWYAYLTKQIADSARASAEQSRIAAEASLSSAAAVEASIDVHFDVEPTELVFKFELRERAPRAIRITSWRAITLAFGAHQ
jgi:hypothetical protein